MIGNDDQAIQTHRISQARGSWLKIAGAVAQQSGLDRFAFPLGLSKNEIYCWQSGYDHQAQIAFQRQMNGKEK
jgi:hypothetical protein